MRTGTGKEGRGRLSRCEPYRELIQRKVEEGQVDFGSMYLLEGCRGRRRKAHIWRTVLSFSRKGYSEAILWQDSESFIRALENAFGYFGGVPRRICLDNLSGGHAAGLV